MKKNKEVTGHQFKYKGKWYEVNETDGILYKVFDTGNIVYEREYYEIKMINNHSAKHKIKNKQEVQK